MELALRGEGVTTVRDALEDVGVILTAVFLVKLASRWQRDPWWKPDHTDKGGRGAGPGASSTPVPEGAANLWSEVTMRMFAEQMYQAGVDARLVLLGIAASSNFNADEELGNNVGLLMLNRDHLSEVGYPEDAPPFEQLDAVHQIPWIAKVIAYRMADTGGRAPTTIGELATLLHPANSTITAVIRAEAERRANDAKGRQIYIAHDNLLRKVLANP
jgi:hypothetical protein